VDSLSEIVPKSMYFMLQVKPSREPRILSMKPVYTSLLISFLRDFYFSGLLNKLLLL